MMRSRLTIALIIILIAAASFNSPGTGDRGRWLIYMDLVRHYGPIEAYRIASWEGCDNYSKSPAFDSSIAHVNAVVGGPKTDYPPVIFILFAPLVRIGDLLQLNDFVMLKLSLIASLLCCAIVTGRWKGGFSELDALLPFAGLAANALYAVYLDAYIAAGSLIAFFCLKRNFSALSVASMIITVFTKWQAIIVLPFAVISAFRSDPKRRLAIGITTLVSIAVALAIWRLDPFLSFIQGQTEDHLSGNALNANWLITGFIEIIRTGHMVEVTSLTGIRSYPVVAFGTRGLALALCAFCLVRCWFAAPTLRNALMLATAAYVSYCCFWANVHENHWSYAAALGILLCIEDRSFAPDAAMLAAIAALNIFVFYGLSGKGYEIPHVIGVDLTLVMAAAIVIYVVAFVTRCLLLSCAILDDRTLKLAQETNGASRARLGQNPRCDVVTRGASMSV